MTNIIRKHHQVLRARRMVSDEWIGEFAGMPAMTDTALHIELRSHLGQMHTQVIQGSKPFLSFIGKTELLPVRLKRDLKQHAQSCPYDDPILSAYDDWDSFSRSFAYLSMVILLDNFEDAGLGDLIVLRLKMKGDSCTLLKQHSLNGGRGGISPTSLLPEVTELHFQRVVIAGLEPERYPKNSALLENIWQRIE